MQRPDPDSGDFVTVIGRFEESGDATVTVIERDAEQADPHWIALLHAGQRSQSGDFEVVALLRGRCEVLVTQQSLRLFSARLLAQE